MSLDSARAASAERRRAAHSAPNQAERDRRSPSAVFAAEAAAYGYTVLALVCRGQRVKVRCPDGALVGTTAARRLVREMKLHSICAACGGAIDATGSRRRRRVDGRFCSSACRQRAYRERRLGMVDVSRVTSTRNVRRSVA